MKKKSEETRGGRGQRHFGGAVMLMGAFCVLLSGNPSASAVPLETPQVLAREAPVAAQVLELCHSYEVPCVLHTYPDAARALGCTSIHLPLPLLRECAHELNDFTQIGSSVHSVEDAMEAERLGATYVTAGHVYVTDCKKGLAPRGLDFLRNVCKSVSIPVYAIGGIQLDADTHTIAQNQAAEIASCGAKGGCIMSGMMQFTP